MPKIVDLEVHDIRFPTSRELDGSDAMNPDPDYSASYVELRADDGPDGYGFAFTIGRGNDVQAAAIRALAPLVAGRVVPLAPVAPGFSARMHDATLRRFRFPDGPEWTDR